MTLVSGNTDIGVRHWGCRNQTVKGQGTFIPGFLRKRGLVSKFALNCAKYSLFI